MSHSKYPGYSQGNLDHWINASTTLFWFRRDLRLDDNTGLYHALKESGNVLPLFIFDTEIINKLDDPAAGESLKVDHRIEFIYQSLRVIKNQLETIGSSLLILHGDPIEIFKRIKPKSVYANHDYEPYARDRDEAVKNILMTSGVVFKTFKDHVIFEKSEVAKENQTPYTVFTPYSRKWKSKLTPFYYQDYPVAQYEQRFKQGTPIPFPELTDIGFAETGFVFPELKIDLSILEQYDRQRDFPSVRGTTRLGLHLRFGTLSVRRLASMAANKNETFLNELIWRDFFQMILWHFPHVATSSFKRAYDRIEWNNDPRDFEAWCNGQTGYPIVDAGMRELNETGFMHNRVRMITASFLTKHLLIDWRWGADYFARKLLDFDLAANHGGWQWAAGSGCDAAPYFRIFNPTLQGEKFDPKKEYIKKWVPEFGDPSYVKAIVDHAFARERVLRAYKKALKE